ncbi:Cytochrome c7 c [uncultured archaeon]|nr:Cytochrome c7 c [uncultured archaeon]
MNTKFTLAIIALVGIGVFALPSTMSLFAGQHSFYNIDATGNQVPCQKCHGDVKAELQGSSNSITPTKGPHADFQCEYCHRAEQGFASGDDAYASITYSSAAGARISLVTTVQNFERGNFPKGILYTAAMATAPGVDGWEGNVFNADGSAFLNQTQFSDANGKYAGSLQSNGVAGTLYNYSYASEVSTYASGTYKDTNLTSQKQAFNPRAVTFTNATASLVNAGSREVTPGTTYHAASLVSCLECHGGDQTKGVAGYEVDTPEPYNHAGWLIDPTNPNSNCANCHYSTASHTPAFETQLAAGGFGLTGNANDTGSTEAHNAFVKTNDGINRFGYGASNGACVACHTHVAVDINFKKGYKLAFDAIEQKNGSYSVGNFAVEGSVNVAIYGNGSGQTFGVGDKSYTWTPTKTLYVNGNGAVITGLNGASSDNATALTN